VKKLYIALLIFGILLIIVGQCCGFTITSGGLYTGINEEIYIFTSQPVTLQSCNSPKVTNVSGTSYGPPVNVTLRDSRFITQSPSNTGDNQFDLVYFEGAASVIVWNCYFNGQVGNAGGLCAGGLVIWGGHPGSVPITIAASVFLDCSPAIQISGYQSDPAIGIYGNQVLQTTAYQHNDEISLFESSGVLGFPIMVQNNLINWNPDAPQVKNAGGIVPDLGSSYIHVVGNVSLNQGIGAYYDDGNTDIFEDNLVIGLGDSKAYSYGIAIWPGGGHAINNTVLWVPQAGGGQPFYLGNAGGGNNPAPTGNDNVGDTGQVLLANSLLTRAFEVDLYNQWLTDQELGGATYPSELP